MFEELAKYKRIIVSGAQRSGTTICARIISYELGYEYIDENDYKIHSVPKLKEILKFKNIVIQAPAMAHCIEEFSDDDTLIIFMRREIKDIIASQKRIGWDGNEKTELKKYGLDFNVKQKPISVIKYKKWEEQKKFIKHYIEIYYESLKGHKLWVDKKDRNDFTLRQWEK